MGRYVGPSCKLCRREGEKLFLKGLRCNSEKCGFERKGYPPGQHGRMRKKISPYGLQLREKQKMRRYYGLLEKQFKLTFKRAVRDKGVTGDKLLQRLELRLDNFAFRAGFATSRAAARQLVRHGHILVNGKKIDIPSYLLKEGQVFSVYNKENSRNLAKTALEQNSYKKIPDWIKVEPEKLTATLLKTPSRDEIPVTFNEQYVVELYSK